jgi:hypothetical protein
MGNLDIGNEYIHSHYLTSLFVQGLIKTNYYMVHSWELFTVTIFFHQRTRRPFILAVGIILHVIHIAYRTKSWCILVCMKRIEQVLLIRISSSRARTYDLVLLIEEVLAMRHLLFTDICELYVLYKKTMSSVWKEYKIVNVGKQKLSPQLVSFINEGLIIKLSCYHHWRIYVT